MSCEDFPAEDTISEVAPKGWKGTVRAMLTKHKGEIDNPYALGWHMKHKGDKPHYKDQKSTLKGKPKKKKKYKDEDKKEKKKDEAFLPTWSEWLLWREAKGCSCPCPQCKSGTCDGCDCDACTCDGCNCKR